MEIGKCYFSLPFDTQLKSAVLRRPVYVLFVSPAHLCAFIDWERSYALKNNFKGVMSYLFYVVKTSKNSF